MRVGYGSAILAGVSLAVYAGVSALPGDAATQVAGVSSADELARLRVEYGLDQPIWNRYASWVASVFDGSFGTSLPSGRPVASLLAEPVAASVSLAIPAALVMLVAGVGAGIWAGVRPGSRLDRTVGIGALLSISAPEFVAATLAIVVFADVLGWFPSVSLIPIGGSVWSDPVILVLPVLCLGLYGAGSLARLVRGAVRVSYDQPHVRSAELAGVAPGSVVVRHVLPTAWGPIAQAVAMFVPYLLGGAVVVERVFGYPGAGSLLVERIAARDTDTVMTVVAGLSLVTVAGYLLADLFSARLARRVPRTGSV